MNKTAQRSAETLNDVFTSGIAGGGKRTFRPTDAMKRAVIDAVSDTESHQRIFFDEISALLSGIKTKKDAEAALAILEAPHRGPGQGNPANEESDDDEVCIECGADSELEFEDDYGMPLCVECADAEDE